MDFEREYQINETSMSSLLERNEEFDCVFITAFRLTDNCNTGKLYTKKENMARNRSLKLKLMRSWYSITRVLGVYYDNKGEKQKEIAFFVVDGRVSKDDPLEKIEKYSQEFLKDMIYFGELFEQDSILFMPKRTVLGKATATLYGANDCPDTIGRGKKKDFNKGARINKTSKLYITIVNGKPMYFEMALDEVYRPQTGFGYLGLAMGANTPWTELVKDITVEDEKNYLKNSCDTCCKTRPGRLLDEINNYNSKNGE